MTTAEVLRLVADNWIPLTRGPMGVIVPRPVIPSLNAIASFPHYYLAIVILVVGLAYLAVRRLLRAPIGRAWIAVRESLELAESVGIPTLRIIVQNLAISGALGSVAGALLAPRMLVVTPRLLTPVYSATAMLIVILGGRGTLLGPIVGGAIFAWLPELLRSAGDLRFVAFGALLIAVVRLLPGGLISLLPFQRRPSSVEPSSEPQPAEPQRLQGDNPIALAVEGLSKHYRGLVAVNNASFAVRAGEILGLMGPNGAGKSTCMSMANGFVRPTSGTIRLFGEDVSALAPHERCRRGLARTFQQTTVFRDLSAADNVLIATHGRRPVSLVASLLQGPRFRKNEAARRAIAAHLLERVGLAARVNALAKTLSYGEQRLLSIAVALATAPRVLLLDEPAAGLNPIEAKTLTKLLRGLAADGLAVVLVEHNVPMMMSLCDRLVVLHHGELITTGTPAEVRRHPLVSEAYFGAGRAA